MERPPQFRDPELETSGERIGFYPREFYMLDNFSAFKVFYLGHYWSTAEHAYQAAKFIHSAPDIVNSIRNAKSPHEAQKIGRENRELKPEDWDIFKVEIMYQICKSKLRIHPYVQQKLLETGDLEIVEDSPKDDFWGTGPNKDGQNELGKIWMWLRSELKASEIKIGE